MDMPITPVKRKLKSLPMPPGQTLIELLDSFKKIAEINLIVKTYFKEKNTDPKQAQELMGFLGAMIIMAEQAVLNHPAAGEFPALLERKQQLQERLEQHGKGN